MCRASTTIVAGDELMIRADFEVFIVLGNFPQWININPTRKRVQD